MHQEFFLTLTVCLIFFYFSGVVLSQGGLGDLLPCMEGNTKPCGSNVGECEKGTRTCTNGAWGECKDAVMPEPEICDDGLDNDCNGLVDDCAYNLVSYILIGAGIFFVVIALILSRME